MVQKDRNSPLQLLVADGAQSKNIDQFFWIQFKIRVGEL